MPKEPGKAQEELRIEKEASYIVSVINPKVHVPEGYPSTEQPPEYPESIFVGLESKENYTSPSKDIRLIGYPNTQVILIGAREGKDVLMKEIDKTSKRKRRRNRLQIYLKTANREKKKSC